MFWGDTVAEEVVKRYKSVTDSGKPIVIRDEKTASGRVHVGSLRSACLHATVAELLKEKNIAHEFIFEINDFDPMDGLPIYLDKATYEPHLGKPLCNIPSPEAGFSNFAECYGGEYVKVMKGIGYTPTVTRASEQYKSGKMNDVIRTALEKRAIIRKIYKEESGGERPETWYPLNVVCENCGKLSTTSVTGFDGKEVTYICRENAVEWTKGCNHEGTISPFDGNAKLPWKVEWAAKFKVYDVNFEGAGKDHYTKGGSRQVANRIAKEVFDFEPPYGVANEFFLVGGAKMSSSKGAGTSAREISELLPPHILRLLLIKSDIGRQVNFDPEGDAIPVLFDHYDKIATKYWKGEADDDARVFKLSHREADSNLLDSRYLPRFSTMAFVVQMPHLELLAEVERIKEAPLTDADKTEVELRATYARIWLEKAASDEFIFKLQEELPESAQNITEAQKKAVGELVEAFQALSEWNGLAIHSAIHAVRESSGLSPKELFAPLYMSLFGKDSGPKLGWFLSTLVKDFVVNRFKSVT